MRLEMVWVKSRWQLVNAKVDDDQRMCNDYVQCLCAIPM